MSSQIVLSLAMALPLCLSTAQSALAQSVSHGQRVATLGGTAPKSVCGKVNESEKQVVTYSADYIFYKAM